MKNSHAERRYSVPVRPLTPSDWNILDSYKSILRGLVLVNGPNCVASLHSAENRAYPCIAVENGEIDDITIGTHLPSFPADALTDEAYRGGKDTIGLYYARTKDDHSLKCVINVIRNENRDLIGALCVSVDVSVPLHQFMRSYIPVVDNDLAVGISEMASPIETVEDMIKHSIEQAVINANNYRGISATERNRMIVKQLNANGIFNIRGAVSSVADELGVSRYSIYNYLKDSLVEPEPEGEFAKERTTP